MGSRFEKDIANPEGFSALTYTTTNWDDQTFGTSQMRREHSFRDMLEPRSIRHRRLFGLGHLVRKFRTLPLEVMQMMLNAMDLATLISFRQISVEARALVDSLRSFQVLNKHATDIMQAMLVTGVGSKVTADQIVETLYSENCQFCGAFGGFIYLPRCARCCFRCVSHDRRALSIPGDQAMDELGLDLDTVRQLPGIQTQTRQSFWSEKSPVESTWMVDWTAAVKASATITKAVTARSSTQALTHPLFKSSTAGTTHPGARAEWYVKIGEKTFPSQQPSAHLETVRLHASRKYLRGKHPSMALPSILHKRLSNPDRYHKTTYPPLPKLPRALLHPSTPNLLRHSSLLRAPVLRKPPKGSHHLAHTLDPGTSCLSCRKYWNFLSSLNLTHHSDLPMFSSLPPSPNPNNLPAPITAHLLRCPLTHYHHRLLLRLPLCRTLHRLVKPPPTQIICRPTWRGPVPGDADVFRPLTLDHEERYKGMRERDPCLDAVYRESWVGWATGGDEMLLKGHEKRWMVRRERMDQRRRGEGEMDRVRCTLQDI